MDQPGFMTTQVRAPAGPHESAPLQSPRNSWDGTQQKHRRQIVLGSDDFFVSRLSPAFFLQGWTEESSTIAGLVQQTAFELGDSRMTFSR